jgi:hypothetical protein
MKGSPLQIRYSDFHDVARAFLVEYEGAVYFFDCPFDDQLDEYPDAYQVFRIEDEHRAALADAVPWRNLRSMSTLVATIPVAEVEFDPTRRTAISDSVLASLL